MTGHQWLDVLVSIVLALFLILLLLMAVLVVRRPKGKTRELEAAYRRFSSSDALMTACTQPGCSGTIVDGYCDVCGSPAGAAPFAPAEPAASEASPASAGGPRPMAVRWALGVIVGLFLLGAGVVLYRVVPGPQTSASSSTTTADSAPTETASPSEVPSSAGLSAPSDSGSGSEESRPFSWRVWSTRPSPMKPFESKVGTPGDQTRFCACSAGRTASGWPSRYLRRLTNRAGSPLMSSLGSRVVTDFACWTLARARRPNPLCW